MGGDGDAGMGPVGVILRQRFNAEHIQCGMADMARGECSEEGVIVDQRAAAGVQDCGPLGQQGEGAGVQQVFGYPAFWAGG